MKLSIVIVNYNVQYFLELCIRSVQEACKEVEAEIIVVDNISGDNSCAMVRENFPNVRLIENKENVGFSKANNQGVAIAKGEYVLILNPDTVISENTLLEIVNFADSKLDLGALGVQLIDGTGEYLPESKRGIPTLKASFYKVLGRGDKKGNYYANHLNNDGVGSVDVLVGAFMLMKTETYKKVGGFDEDYFMYGEDIDLSYKLLKQGLKNYYLGTSKIIHFKGESTRKDVRYLKHFHGAMEIFYKKHFSSNILYDLSTKLGIRIWFLLKYLKMTDAPILIENREHVLYIGAQKIEIEEQMDLNLEYSNFKSYEEISKNIIDNSIEEVWFDTSHVSYEKIINMIAIKHNKKVIFKIHPANTKFVIGSNSSDGRGEIIGLL